MSLKLTFLALKKMVQVVQNGELEGGGVKVIWTKSKRTATFFGRLSLTQLRGSACSVFIIQKKSLSKKIYSEFLLYSTQPYNLSPVQSSILLHLYLVRGEEMILLANFHQEKLK